MFFIFFIIMGACQSTNQSTNDVDVDVVKDATSSEVVLAVVVDPDDKPDDKPDEMELTDVESLRKAFEDARFEFDMMECMTQSGKDAIDYVLRYARLPCMKIETRFCFDVNNLNQFIVFRKHDNALVFYDKQYKGILDAKRMFTVTTDGRLTSMQYTVAYTLEVLLKFCA